MPDEPKRGRGRPRKHPAPDPEQPKRGRGRPKKDPGKPKLALPLPSMEARRREWEPYPFGEEKVRKVELLAQLEALFVPTEACRAAGVLRFEYETWYEADEVFRLAVTKALEVCVKRVEAVMYLAATTLDERGKIQTTAAFGILNSKTSDWGLLKAQLYARVNSKFIEAARARILAKLPADTADALRAELDALCDQASRLPAGATLK